MASSNFLNKTGLSYFYSKIKEMLQKKQDKLVAGDNITIGTDNKIKAYNKVFVGICSSAETDAVKEVSCPEWVLAEDNVIVVKFLSGNNQAQAELDVEETGAIPISWINTTNMWQAGAYIAFAYDAIYEEFHAINMDVATQDTYGVVRLSDAVDLDSSIYASTARATKQAYDLADIANAGLVNKQDTLTAGDGITIDENNVISATGGGGGTVGMETKTVYIKPQEFNVDLRISARQPSTSSYDDATKVVVEDTQFSGIPGKSVIVNIIVTLYQNGTDKGRYGFKCWCTVPTDTTTQKLKFPVCEIFKVRNYNKVEPDVYFIERGEPFNLNKELEVQVF